MTRIDDLITGALTEEDRALLASHGEPGYFAQAFGLFRGPLAWIMWLVYLVGGVAFLAGAWAVWTMWGATDTLLALKWGVLALFLFQVAVICKIFLGNHMEANRLLRELKRVELQVSLLRSGAGIAK